MSLLHRIPWRHEDKLLKALGIGGGAYALSWSDQLTSLQFVLVIGWLVIHVLVVLASLGEPLLVRRIIRRHPDFEEWRTLLTVSPTKLPKVEAALRETLDEQFPTLSRNGREAAIAEVRGARPTTSLR